MSFITPCCVYDITTIGICKYYAALCPCCYYLSLLSNKLHNDILTSTWNESSQGLVFLISIPVGLPPVGVILADDMEYISLLEGQAKLSTRHEGVIRRVVVKVRSYVHLRAGFYIVKDSCTHADRPSHTHTATYCKMLTTVCLCGAGLI